MQKKLIALAVAGLVAAPVAMAQSNVTVYGVADAYFGYGKMGENKFRGVNSGGLAGSRLGFRGTEDLGNGLKAIFTLEYGLDIDVNEGVGTSESPNRDAALRARQQFVGLQGGFGSVTLGRQYAPGFWILRYDAFGGMIFSPQSVLSARSAGSTITPNNPARWNNSVAYKSPNFNGLTAELLHSFGERQPDNRRLNNKTGMAVHYANGPIGAGFIYHYLNNGTGVKNTKEWALGGSYDFGAVKLLASYQRMKDVAGRSGDTDKLWQIGAAIPVSAAGAVQVSYGRFKADADDFDSKSWGLGYTHNLSKRTALYANYTRVRNDDAQVGRVAQVAAADAGNNASGFGMGIRHAF